MTSTLSLYLLATHALFACCGLITALHALLHARTPQGTIAWIFALILIPELALPVYLAVGRTRLDGYIEARRNHAHHYENIRQLSKTCAVNYASPPLNSSASNKRETLKKFLSNLVHLPFTQGNSLEILIDGHQTFTTLFEEIDKAQQYIVIEFFIIKNDTLGEALQKRLIAKANQGVNIYLIFDEIGSHKLPASYIHAFKKHPHIKASSFYGRRRWFTSIFRINFRNHRKLVIIDGQTGFIGGLNVGNEYLGHGKLGKWRDTFVKIKGLSLHCLLLAFLEDWHWSTQEILHLPCEPKPEEANKNILILPSGPADQMETWRLTILSLINAAEKRIWIASPYFVPDESVIASLQMAALRGVDVRILLPNKADHLLIYASSYAFYPDILPYGIKLYRYKKGFLHEKIILIDHDISTIGTANFDNRSMRLNFEITALCEDEDIAQQVEKMLKEDFSHSRKIPINYNNTWFFPYKLGSRIAALFSPLQ